MTALAPIPCAKPAQIAAKAALVRRIEAASRANEDRQDAPRDGHGHARPQAPGRAVQPLSSIAAHILGAYGASPQTGGYGAYEKAARLLVLESHRVDLTIR